MPLFHYRALGQTGETTTGTIETASEESAAAQLQAKGLLPVSIGTRAQGGLWDLLNMEITPRDALGARDRLILTQTLATLLGASLPLDRALATIQTLEARKPVRAMAERLLARVSEGQSLADALDREPQAFPRLYRAMVRAGERGAALEETLARLADLLEASAKRRGALRSALIYPVFLVVTAIGSVAILMAFVVPTFKPLLEDAGVTPPPLTRAVIAVGDVFAAHGLTMLAGFAVLVLVAMLMLRNGTARLASHRFALRLPLIGRLWRDYETAGFSRILGVMLQNGVALPAALRLAHGVQGNQAFAREIDRVVPQIEDGRSMASALEQGGVFSPIALQLIGVGQESGRLMEMLLKSADILEGDFKRAFDQMLAMLTPLLTLVMGGIVALIVSSILFALFSINELAL